MREAGVHEETGLNLCSVSPDTYASPIAFPVSDHATTTLGRSGWLPSGQLLMGALRAFPPSPGCCTKTNSAVLSGLNAGRAICSEDAGHELPQKASLRTVGWH